MSNTSLTRPGRQLWLAFLLSVLSLTAFAPQAGATARIDKVFGGPVTGLADCNPTRTAPPDGVKDATAREDFCVAFSVSNPDGTGGVDLKSQVVDTPRGFVGEPDRTPTCSDALFAIADPGDAECPAESQVGEVSADIDVQLLNMNLKPTGAVYNLPHGPNEVARLGIDLRPVAQVAFLPLDQPNVKIVVRITLRPAPDVGLRSIIDDMPAKAKTSVLGLPGETELALKQFNLLFWGEKGTRAMGNDAFAMLGSNCEVPQETKISAVTHDGTASSGASPTYRLENCANAGAFRPSVAYGASDTRPDATTETTVAVRFDTSGSGGKVSPAPKQTVVVLPQGLSFSGQIASGPNGLPLCTYEQYGQTRPEASQCPDTTAVGTVRFDSPVLKDDLKGQAFLGPQAGPGALPDLFIEAQLGPAADAPRVKLIGKLTVDEQNRIVATLDDLPEVPVDEFFLTFRGGDHAAIVTPPTCGTFEGYLDATAWTGANGRPAGTLTIPEQPDCAVVQAFTPGVSFGLSDPKAGGNGVLTTSLTRPDRTQRLGRVHVDLPPGQLANLKGVPECAREQAAANACPPETRVGTISAWAGVGPKPYQATGAVYLTNREAGAVAGLSFNVPVAFGEVDLGMLPVPARVEIRPDDLGLRVIADVPDRFAGIPLNIQRMDIALDRPGFALAPTNCGVLQTSSFIASNAGASAQVPAGMQVQGCESLKFEPQLQAAVTGATKQGSRPNLTVRINIEQGSGAMRNTVVTLPKGISVDLTQVNSRGCELATFRAGGCPPNAVIGKVSGALSITEEPLGGEVMMVRIPGKVLPGLGLNFTGRFAGRVVGENEIAKTGQIVASFPAIPDLPLTELRLDLTGGNGGTLVAGKDLCTNGVLFQGRFIAHSGQNRERSYESFCGQALSSVARPSYWVQMGGLRKGRPTVNLRLTAPRGKKIRQVDLSYPKQWKLSKSAARSSRKVAVSRLSVKLTKARRKQLSTKGVSTRKLRVRLPKVGSTKVKIVSRTGVLSVKSKSARRTKKRVVLTATIRYTDGSKATMPIRIKPR